MAASAAALLRKVRRENALCQPSSLRSFVVAMSFLLHSQCLLHHTTSDLTAECREHPTPIAIPINNLLVFLGVHVVSGRLTCEQTNFIIGQRRI
jgi:hypothetical protein